MSEKVKLTLLHSNDLHGDFLAEQIDGKLTGGVSMLSGYINSVRASEENTLFAIAGDMFRGSIIDAEFKGMSTIELMNYLAPDIVTIGNHETDYGIAHLLFLEKCAKFPIINANLYIKSNHSRLFSPYKIINVNGINIMFIGILTEEVLEQTKGEELIGSFIDIWEAAKEIGVIIDNYKTTCVDYTVLLTHIGFEEDQKLASILDKELGVDLIIGGHSHTKLSEPYVVNDIPIVQVGCGTDQIGRFDLVFDKDNHKLESSKWQIVEINEQNCTKDPIMEELLSSYKSETDKKYQRIITTFKHPLTHPARNRETELGNLFADLLQVDSSFDIMLMASGSIRLPKLGPIVTYQDLKECVPFNASIFMLQVSGAQFKHMMKYMLRDEALVIGAHTEFYQVSKGVHIVYDYNTKQLMECKLNGKEIEDDQKLKIALQTYHYSNFTKFFDLDFETIAAQFKPRMVISSELSIFEELMVGNSNMDARIENRIQILNRPE